MRKLFLHGGIMRRYYLHTRKGLFYAELIDPTTGSKLPARSTGTGDRDAALLVIADWLKNGIPKKKGRQVVETAAKVEILLKQLKQIDLTSADAVKIVKLLRDRQLIDTSAVEYGKGSLLFTSFLKSFWDYETSKYIREKHAHGHSIGKRHAHECMLRISRYWLPYFKDRLLNTITREDLKEFSLSLTTPREKPVKCKGLFVEKLSPGAINKIMTAGLTAIKWAYREGYIPTDPTIGLLGFSGKPKKRGVLTVRETEAVFKTTWKDKRAYIASLLACTTGLRSGEVLALKKDDIEAHSLNIRHSWSDFDGLKSPKNGEARKVPLLPEVKIKLLELLRDNPYGEDGFIFWSTTKDKPVHKDVLLDNLQEALEGIGINAKDRNIVFHSWRHYYAARMADKMTAEQVSRITGHKSRAVFEEYADHITAENLAEVGKVGAEVFSNILQFKKGA